MGMFVVPTWKRLMNDSMPGTKMPQPDADRHRQEDPQGQEAIQK